LTKGRILQFDQSRGYGFVAAEDGGEDIFLHASVFHGDPDLLTPGTMVEFQTMAGDRGRKAYNAQLADEEPGGPELARPVPGPPVPVQAPPVAQLLAEQDDQMCDVLSAAELRQELTELLLNAVPELTGQQIVQARQSLLEFAKEHGWSDG
jgi:cold shock protein